MASVLPMTSSILEDSNESQKVYFHSGSQATYRKIKKNTETAAFTIPIIDISNINSPLLETKKQIAKEIHDACSTCGFFYLKNHGLSDELVEETFALMKRFFALDLDIKMSAYVHKNPAIRGYEPMKHNNMGKSDLKEAFTMGDCPLEPEQCYQAKTKSLPPSNLTKPQNIWPSEAPWFREGIYKYYQAIFPLALKLVSLFALAFDLEENAFDHMFKFPITGMRPLFYPSMSQISHKEGKEEDLLGLGAHADFSYLTLLLQDPNTPALEILSPTAHWIPAPPIPSTLLCNVGQYLSHHTASKFPATVHRVRNLTSQERYSLPFFLTPDPDAELEALPCCIDEGMTGDEGGFGEVKVNVGEMYVRRVLAARKSHPTSVRYRDVPEEQWRYDFLLS